MSIKQFYYLLGKQSLHISIYFSLIAYIFLYIYVTRQKLELAIYLLMFLSIFYYSFHLYYLRRSNQTFVQMDPYDHRRLDFPNIYLIEQDQNNFYFFHPDGVAESIGKIQFTWRGWCLSYFFRDEQKQRFKLKIKNNQIHFHIDSMNIYITKESRKLYGKIQFVNKTITFTQEKYNEITFYDKYIQIASVKKGWLPTELTKRFRLNIPILCFLERVTTLEKDAIFMVLMIIYWK
ncbi:hypothetical protein OEV82_15060 [Caldibacillus thermolactis]|jgi:hypothetical protein|uniref:Uncharacterized protein n=1 Tax=Pallidibacillus thermolactis TaxID=251051 RepID=A0ABT2WJ72_9BACI|nr:hypothetical protein [Pallidibacillus thermolactis]MCU9595744.1 hypothetical protein [Pallidibacillus thermolactis]MCU9602004.1 hypothetical protein [Pallidibacillus thermolactis subsp. kokeshiiformis]MED1673597.1 hypothetical protein [Pallidibacillus thermolactis subsp. kokeshiiformis]